MLVPLVCASSVARELLCFDFVFASLPHFAVISHFIACVSIAPHCRLQLRIARDTAEARAETAEGDAAMCRAAQAEAAAARDDALAAARQLRSRLEVTELALQRAHADGETRSRAVDDLASQVRESALRAEAAESALSIARAERDGATRRAAGMERELTRAQSGNEELRHAAEAAGEARAAAEDRFRVTADTLAATSARVEALEHAAEASAARTASLEAALGDERGGRVSAETEVARLRDELSRRPPLDVLRSLDIDALLHKNLQAAAALQSLLQFAQVGGGGAGSGAGAGAVLEGSDTSGNVMPGASTGSRGSVDEDER